MCVACVTRKLTSNKNIASKNSKVRDDLRYKSANEENKEISNRYFKCSICDQLSDSFTMFGSTVKKDAPQCVQCGCALNTKIRWLKSKCPMNKW